MLARDAGSPVSGRVRLFPHDRWTGELRPTVPSTDAVSYVRNTSIPDVQSLAGCLRCVELASLFGDRQRSSAGEPINARSPNPKALGNRCRPETLVRESFDIFSIDRRWPALVDPPGAGGGHWALCKSASRFWPRPDQSLQCVTGADRRSDPTPERRPWETA